MVMGFVVVFVGSAALFMCPARQPKTPALPSTVQPGQTISRPFSATVTAANATEGTLSLETKSSSGRVDMIEAQLAADATLKIKGRAGRPGQIMPGRPARGIIRIDTGADGGTRYTIMSLEQ